MSASTAEPVPLFSDRKNRDARDRHLYKWVLKAFASNVGVEGFYVKITGHAGKEAAVNLFTAPRTYEEFARALRCARSGEDFYCLRGFAPDLSEPYDESAFAAEFSRILRYVDDMKLSRTLSR
jgi:hypothetical protein